MVCWWDTLLCYKVNSQTSLSWNRCSWPRDVLYLEDGKTGILFFHSHVFFCWLCYTYLIYIQIWKQVSHRRRQSFLKSLALKRLPEWIHIGEFTWIHVGEFTRLWTRGDSFQSVFDNWAFLRQVLFCGTKWIKLRGCSEPCTCFLAR